MGSVIDYIDCPHCSQEATLDFYYKTGEEYIICTNCGYNRAYYISRKNDYEDVSEPVWITEELKNPYGIYKLRYKGEVATKLGSLENEDHWVNFVSDVMQDKDKIEMFTLNRFINNQIETTTII